MTTTPMKERLARIAAGNYWDRMIAGLRISHPSRDSFVDEDWKFFVDDNDAILREMLEPSEGMLVIHRQEGFWRRWQDIIQHILNESQD